VWTANYGAWVDELGTQHESACLETIWRKPSVTFEAGRSLTLDRPYGRFDNRALQRHLTDEFVKAGGVFIRAKAEDVAHDTHGSRLELSDGSTLDTAVVVDATGANSRFVMRQSQRPAFQSAYGEWLEVDRHHFAAGEMALMDFSGTGPEPTFLYAMPVSDQLIFVEETSLVARPPMSHGLLRKRLMERLSGWGLAVRRVVDREVCLIAMGHGLPNASQRTIAYGSAASFVHPATGYQVARALRLARPTARAIADGLSLGPQRAAAEAYEVMWPSAARRAWHLYTFGMEVLAGMSLRETRSFMEGFFDLPSRVWGAYMSGTLAPSEIVAAMARVFANVDNGLRLSLLGAGTRSKPLWRAMWSGGVR
jgi:lycopene beta-cyclase